MMDMSKRTAVVTGSGRGIGRSIATHLAASGALIILIARTAEELDQTAKAIELNGGKAHSFSFDLGRLDQLPAFCDRILADVGNIDILINNAAITGPVGSLPEVDLDDWMHALSVNLIAPVILSGKLVPAMVRRGWGRIVNISTGAVSQPSMPQRINSYVTSKAGLEAHSLNLATDLAGSGVTVNVLRPGIVDTEMQSHLRDLDPRAIGTDRFKRNAGNGSLLSPDLPGRAALEIVFGEFTGRIIDLKLQPR